ncbi:hypothetical protein T12_11288 [Trichinella patagoniensis]|uniref:Uncharacterized protein n=1 Tax=Trichinella patagoniensis TaxID=990121 RepID=A0A0V1ABQ6_9BILA|nr:hypothetical protein T12_11288 [Trichinella patagoniensis]
MIFRTKIHRLTILLVFSFAASRAFLSDDDTDILRKARAWIAKHRLDYSLAFSTNDDPCEVLYDTAKRQLRWIHSPSSDDEIRNHWTLQHFYADQSSGSQTFLGCNPLSKTVIFCDPPAFSAYFKSDDFFDVRTNTCWFSLQNVG